MRRYLLPAALIACSVSANAGDAEICYSAWSATSTPPATNSTVFNCPVSGARTLPQLAAAGWSVVQLSPIADLSTGAATYAHQLVIQKR